MKIKSLIYVFTIALIFTACDLTKSIDDYSPSFVLEAEIAISDEASAELALTGMFSSFRQGYPGGFQPNFPIAASQMGFTAGRSSYYTGQDADHFVDNDPDIEGSEVPNMYGAAYTIINQANWLIEKVALLDDAKISANRKAEIIGEATWVRALVHFYVLRFWGQFYDRNSEYGIVLKTEPQKEAVSQARATVQAVYDQLIIDLDDAIAKCSDFRAHYYPSKAAAKALKAKVLLYMGDYTAAASIAKELIDNTTDEYELVSTFNEIFAPAPASFNSKECLFAVHIDADGGVGNYNFYRGSTQVSPMYKDWAANETVTIDGQEIAIDGVRINLVNTTENGKYPQSLDTQFHLRMAEVYLIYAEAETRRSGGDLTDALAKLNAVRLRAGVDPYPAATATTSTDLLEAVRAEKIAELATETGEEWFDMLRYAYVDGGFESGIKVSDFKPSATVVSKFILPIPYTSMEQNEGLVVQNPEY